MIRLTQVSGLKFFLNLITAVLLCSSSGVAQSDEQTPNPNARREILLSNLRPQLSLPKLSTQEKEITKAASFLVYDEMYAHTQIKIDYFKNPHLAPAPRVQQLSTKEKTLPFLEALARIDFDLRDLHQSVRWPKPMACYRSMVPIRLAFSSVVAYDQKVVVSEKNADSIQNLKLRKSYADLLANINLGDEVIEVDGRNIFLALEDAKVFGAGSNTWAHHNEGLNALTFIYQSERNLPTSDVLSLTLQDVQTKVLKKIDIPYLAMARESCFKDPTQKMLTGLPNYFSRISASTHHRPSVFPRMDPKAADQRALGFHKEAKPGWPSIVDYKRTLEPSVGYGVLQNGSHRYGYVRIESFEPEKDVDVTIGEIRNLVRNFNDNTEGLVIDVRDNGGGVYGDYLTQFFSPIQVVSQTEEIRATHANQVALDKMMEDPKFDDPWLKQYKPAIIKAMQEGRPFTERIAINTVEYLNEKGRIYFHPVILLTNPSCYSYCDYFTTSMRDHGAAEVWIVNGDRTGGGGATVVSYSDYSTILPDVFPVLPQGQDMGIAFSSGYRTGPAEGLPIENLGAEAHVVYWLSPRDAQTQGDELFEKIMVRLAKLADKGANL